jgi:hypothetical protein
MRVSEPYRLFFNWYGLKYNGDLASFNEAWFEGPVLQNAARIQDNDYISLDFTSQNNDTGLFLPTGFFIAKLSWEIVNYSEDKITLGSCILSHNKAGSLKELEDGFRFLIDCSKHEEHLHNNTLVYPAWALSSGDVI